MGVAALVLGILGLVGSMVPLLGGYAIVLTGLAVLFGFVGLFIAKGRGMAVAGFVCGLVGTAIAVYWILVVRDVARALQPDTVEADSSFGEPLPSRANAPAKAMKPRARPQQRNTMMPEERGDVAPKPARPRREAIDNVLDHAKPEPAKLAPIDPFETAKSAPVDPFE